MKVLIGVGVKVSAKEVRRAPVFQDWIKSVGPKWQGTVIVNAVDKWEDTIHALQLTTARHGAKWPELVTLRSETVDILSIVTDGSQSWVVFVKQQRDSIGGLVVSNPAGGCNRLETPDQAAERELWEELGLDTTSIKVDVTYTPLWPRPLAASPGMINERVHMMQATIRVAAEDLKGFLHDLHDKRTGVTAEGEELTLVVVPASYARKHIMNEQNPDAKTVLSLNLARM